MLVADADGSESPAIDSEVPQTAASDRGAGPQGFTGTARQDAAGPAGLTALGGGAFGSGPTTPMMPSTWDPDQQEPGRGGDAD